MALSKKLPYLSSGTLRYRLRDRISRQVVPGATVTATLSRNGVAVFSARAMTYDAAGKLDDDDTEVGAYVCGVTSGESTNLGPHDVVINVTSGSNIHRTPDVVYVEHDSGA